MNLLESTTILQAPPPPLRPHPTSVICFWRGSTQIKHFIKMCLSLQVFPLTDGWTDGRIDRHRLTDRQADKQIDILSS